jgi:disulfide bond formation protein DsbB
VGLSPRLLFGFVVLASLAAVGAALVSQHVFNMQPCPWCVLQRLIFLVMAIAALPAAWVGSPLLRKLCATLVTLIGASGVAAALWQHFVAAASASCNMTLADRIVGGLGLDALWPDVFEPRASCSEAAVNLLGLPYEFYSLALFLLLPLAALMAARRRR